MKTIQIVWNTVDQYINVEDLHLSDVDYDKNDDGTYSTFSTKEKFNSFEVSEVSDSELRRDEDGEVICDGLFYVDGTFWKDTGAGK